MATPRIDPERVACVLLSAELLGDQGACKKWKVSRSTLGNYRRYRAERPEVARAWEEKKKELGDRLGTAFMGCMVAGLEKMQELIAAAKAGPEPGALREVAGAVKVLGELHIVREMLGGEQPGPDRQDPPAEEAPSGAEGGETAPVH